MLTESQGVAVDGTTQPELHALVRATLGRLRLEPPDRVRLTCGPDIEARIDGRRRELHVGIQAVPCLSVPELAAVIASRLHLLARPDARKAVRRAEEWFDVGSEAFDEPADSDSRIRRRWAQLAPVGRELIEPADLAAVAACGSVEVAARALATANEVSLKYIEYQWEVIDAARPLGLLAGTSVIVDFDDGWPRWIGPGSDNWLSDDAEEQAMLHPGLAYAMRLIGDGPIEVRVAPDSLRLAPLSERDRRKLARESAQATGKIRWVTFAESPAQWWQQRAAREVSARYGSEFRKRPPTPADRLRLAEECAAARAAAAPGEWDDRAMVDGFAPLLEDGLLPHGWRLEHPAVRGVLVGPDGARIDREMIVKALAEPGLGTLREWWEPART
ncbi:hypothetical protein Val02_10990 [Virgisporangium aliadipatigenens]|uniref:Uncharacterized protein n=1 Tax=Virgisporangium aliadipatigenens TaxID=741659 RepID=A0A8J3YHU0_9ACTN|nr:hypothetical protein [Virgisporangium aliadipatigenens]GIJ44213.1 hypothetical protein Val02_10990 [Virgisporangium aliadipatigenens]